MAGKLAVVGLKVHAVPLGAFKHWKLTLPVAPLWELRPMVKLADCPTESVAEPGVHRHLRRGKEAVAVGEGLPSPGRCNVRLLRGRLNH